MTRQKGNKEIRKAMKCLSYNDAAKSVLRFHDVELTRGGFSIKGVKTFYREQKAGPSLWGINCEEVLFYVNDGWGARSENDYGKFGRTCLYIGMASAVAAKFPKVKLSLQLSDFTPSTEEEVRSSGFGGNLVGTVRQQNDLKNIYVALKEFAERVSGLNHFADKPKVKFKEK